MKLSLVISIDETAFEAVAVRGGWRAGVDLAASLGYDGVELAVRDPAAIDAGALERAVRAAGLAVAALGTGQAYLKDGLSLTSEDAGIRTRAIERIGAHIRLASALGAPVIIGLIRGRLATDRDAADTRLRASLDGPLADADRSGVRLLIEPINRYETDYVNTVADALQTITRVGAPHVGLLADTFHMNIEEASIDRALRDAGARLWHVHVADSNRRAPGLGHLDFPGIIATLKALGYDGYLSAEIIPHPDPSGAAEQAVTHLRAVLAAQHATSRAT